MDASSQWNQDAATYSFLTTNNSTIRTTFETGYTGSNFTADFKSMLKAVAEALHTEVPSYTGEDLLIASVENWPDPS
ncbi:hypothetical protein JW859_05465 [bacterium]|nr:hypothetical protein [bacterium]